MALTSSSKLKRAIGPWRDTDGGYAVRNEEHNQAFFARIKAREDMPPGEFGAYADMAGANAISLSHGPKRERAPDDILRLGLAYHYWKIRLFETGFQAERKEWSMVFNNLTFLTSIGIALDDWHMVEPLCRALRYLLAGHIAFSQKGFAPVIFAPAVVRLADMLQGKETHPKVATMDCGVYEQVFATRGEPEAFQQALYAIAEYHLDHINLSNKRANEFENRPWPLYPFDIWAFNKLNPAVELTHPLTDWAGKQPPAFKISDYRDEAVDRILEVWFPEEA
jgi:hypothetical protein